MSNLNQALDVYCRTKQPAARQALMTALLQKHALLETARNYICKGITKADQDRYQSTAPFRKNFQPLAEMIIILFVDDGMPGPRGPSPYNPRDYTTDGDFFLNAARRVRRFVEHSRPKRSPVVRNRGRGSHGTTAPPAHTAPTTRLVTNTATPGELASRTNQSPIEADWIRERLPPCEAELLQYLQDLKAENSAADLLVACALADFMGVCRFMSRATWQRIVDDAKSFFVEQARKAKKSDETRRMRQAVDLLSQDPKPNDYEQQLLAVLRITANSKSYRINKVQPALQAHCRKLFKKHGLDPGEQ